MRDGPPNTLGCARIVHVVLTLAGALDAFPLVLLTAVAAVVGDVRVGQLGLYGQRRRRAQPSERQDDGGRPRRRR